MTTDNKGFTTMMRAFCCGIACFILLFRPSIATAEVTVEKSEHGAVVKIDGQPFAEYWKRSGHEPAIWPLIGPTGKQMTRAYPIGSDRPAETNDHTHHVSMWFAHTVNGHDFWTANIADRDPKRGNSIVHRDFVTLQSGPTATIVTRNDWMADGDKRICEDERTIVFGKQENGDRWIDFTVKVTASDADITFGDTKEGAFAVRVADPIRVEARKGGRIVNSSGLVNVAAWGQPAEWVDNSGPIDGETVGITLMSHPSSFRPVCRWHARDYGLLAANPFGEREFLAEGGKAPADGKPLQGAYTLEKGKSLNFRYLVLLHKGTADEAHVADVFREFAAKK